MHNYNVERHKEWTQTSQVEDIIYHSWPDSIVRIMYELDTYEKYLGGRRYLIAGCVDHQYPYPSGSVMIYLGPSKSI